MYRILLVLLVSLVLLISSASALPESCTEYYKDCYTTYYNPREGRYTQKAKESSYCKQRAASCKIAKLEASETKAD